jgi:Zn-dependent protease
MFINELFNDTLYYVSWVLVVMFSICVHEYAHAITALHRGDDTAAQRGHLTLNPMVQMGPMSMVLLCLIGLAWGAVPVNPARFQRRGDAALVSFAGPASNLVLSGVFAVLALLFSGFAEVGYFCRLGCLANGVLFVLNMLPVPMLDGWTVFSLFFPAMNRVGVEQARQVSMVALVLIFVTPVGQFIWTAGSAVGMGWMGVFRFLA